MKNYSTFDTTATPGILTGISHLDDLLSVDKGFQNAVIFMTGTSGSGKTTLAKVIQKNISNITTALYERETSCKSVAKQTRRISIGHSNALICDETEYPHFLDFMKAVEEKGINFIIIDSLQTAAVDFVRENNMGEKESEMEVLSVLKKWKDKTGGTAILIGMVNKDGDFSGVNKIKHLADCHLHLVFNKATNTRFMQTTKNRDNSTSKLYYEFVNTSEIVEFYSEKEFELKGKSFKFDDYLVNMIVGFFSVIDKKNPSYKEFIKEYNKEVAIIAHEKSGVTKFEMSIAIATMINEVSKKHGL
jgi:predicted ATP-dependent serine protease